MTLEPSVRLCRRRSEPVCGCRIAIGPRRPFQGFVGPPFTAESSAPQKYEFRGRVRDRDTLQERPPGTAAGVTPLFARANHGTFPHTFAAADLPSGVPSQEAALHEPGPAQENLSLPLPNDLHEIDKGQNAAPAG